MKMVIPLHLSLALSQLLEKTAANRGDPFQKYREQNKAPDTFEYGMNCALDRLFEEAGQESAQLAYSELRKKGFLRIHLDCNVYDIHTDTVKVPILVGFKLSQFIDAYNTAVHMLERGENTICQHVETFLVLSRLVDENDYERRWRLTTVCMAFKYRVLRLHQEGNHHQARSLQECCELLEKLSAISDVNSENDTDTEVESFAMTYGAGAIEKMIPENLEQVPSFVIMIASDFWPTLWTSVLDVFASSYERPAEETFQLFRKLDEDVATKARLSGHVSYETRKARIRQVAPEFRTWASWFPSLRNDSAALLYAAGICKAVGYNMIFPDSLLFADWITQRSLFLEFIRMSLPDLLHDLDPVRRKWWQFWK